VIGAWEQGCGTTGGLAVSCDMARPAGQAVSVSNLSASLRPAPSSSPTPLSGVAASMHPVAPDAGTARILLKRAKTDLWSLLVLSRCQDRECRRTRERMARFQCRDFGDTGLLYETNT